MKSAYVTLLLLISLRTLAGESPVLETSVQPQPREGQLHNPGMGLVLYSSDGREAIPDEADIVYTSVPVWGEIEEEEGRYNWYVPHIKGVIDAALKANRRVALRIMPSFQNNKNAIPKWLQKKGVKLFPADEKWLAGMGQKDLYEPEWWNGKYIDAYEKFVKAYAEKFDGAPWLEYVDIRCYGFWGEGHRFGASVPWPKNVNKRELLKKFIDMHLAAFKKTRLVVELARDKDEPYPQGTAIDYALEKGCWMRRDGFGGFMHKEESALINEFWKTRPLIAENGWGYRETLAKNPSPQPPPPGGEGEIDKLINEMLAHHTNYFPMGWNAADWKALKEQRPDLVKKIVLRNGYRFVVTQASWPGSAKKGERITIQTSWKNFGVGRLPLKCAPAVYLMDRDEPVKGRCLTKDVDVRTWYDGEAQQVAFEITVPNDIKPGDHQIAAAIEDQNGTACIELGIVGDDGQKRYVLGTISIAK
ncbi:MAG TPA: DUF4832 domain-containing protein [Planctomycetota bacterium]|jgi:hypothetical protein